MVEKLKSRMDAIIAEDIPFIKKTVHLNKAREIFHAQGMKDKVKLFKYRKASNVNMYELDGLMDYFYGYMVPSTGMLNGFMLHIHNTGLVLQFAKRENPNEVAKYEPDMMLFQTLLDSMNWASVMDIFDVGSLNDLVADGKANETILVMEALMEKRIGGIADQIVEDVENRKFIFIAGPSSSGKTTFAHRLSIQMKAHGIKPNVISVDNYFKNREDTPKDADGKYDFECLEAINVEAFNKDMLDLLAGKAVDIPVFNFVEGKSEYRGNFITMGPSDVLIIEGIHGLNNGLSYSIPEANKFKIYISALTQLNVDFHNRVPTTDTRLLRRIVRDNQYRGASATKTISMWPSVRHGEDHYIFPFQEEADVMFNSALIYELAVLKQYAEPLLLNVPADSKEYIEAKRLVKFLDYFMTIPSEQIPTNSLIREFIGGSCFRT
jgi:uridine kinase